MYSLLPVILLTLILSACSSGGADTKPMNKALEVDESKPATFSEYKKWRQANDPAGQKYAEYKEWEAAYRRWQQQQSEKLN